MPFSDDRYQLQVQYDTRQFTLTEEMTDRLERELNGLANVVKDFPSPQLHVEIVRHPRSEDFHVKMALKLTRPQVFFTGDRDEQVYSAFKRCARKLVAKAAAYKHEMTEKPPGVNPDPRDGRHVMAAAAPELAAMDEAAENGDYAAFRSASAMYENALGRRIGRWIERYPDAAALLGESIFISEIVEEVFLNAFEQWDRRPAPPQGLGEWLEELIDPAIQALLADPETERENLSYVRSLMGSR